MSWDRTKNFRVCPCGKGQIKEISESDDWNRHRYYEVILCPECKKKDDKEKALKQEKLDKANAKIKETLSYFNDKYYNLLVNEFVDAKTKKDVWNIACRVGAETASLSTFYGSYKGKDQYLSQLVNRNNLEKIINALNIKDEALSELLNDAKAQIKSFDDENYRDAYLRAKGRR